MLEGITVLSENYIDHFSLVGIILCSIVLLLGVALLIIFIKDRENWDGGIIFSIIIILIPLLLILTSIFKKPYTEYKVIIDDTVNFKEFHDRYEIKDQDGEIYTIVEREK